MRRTLFIGSGLAAIQVIAGGSNVDSSSLLQNYFKVYDGRVSTTFQSEKTLAEAHKMAVGIDTATSYACVGYTEGESFGKSMVYCNLILL